MFDKLDAKILEELEIDARQSTSQIARRLKKNKAIIGYRIERMKTNGIITGFNYIANEALIGQVSFGVLVRFKNISVKEEDAFILRIKKVKQVSWICSINGNWDLIFVIREKDVYRFNTVLNNIFSIMQSRVKEFQFYMDYEGGICSHKYLYENPRDVCVRYKFGEVITLKPLDELVYREIRNNPRVSLLKLADSLKITYDTAKARIESMKERKLLLRCSAAVGKSKLGYLDFLCMLNISPDDKRTSQLIEWSIKHPNIVRYVKCLGHFNLILGINAKTIKEIKNIIYELRNKYSDIINSHEIIQLSY